jgi:hypothetical protein
VSRAAALVRKLRSARHLLTVAGAALILVACGADSLTVSEYATAVEGLVTEMEASFASIDTEWEARAPTTEGARDYWERRLEIRAAFLEGVEALDPADAIVGQHETALDLFGRITAADEALAARVATFETITDHWQWVGTPEGHAAEAVLTEVYSFCRATQEEYDATAGRETFEDVPWIPPEMQAVIKVAFGCPP